MAESPTVEMVNIHKRFGGIRALNGVTFAVKKGEVHALLGENGAGKSTLMRVLSGAHKKDEGSIRMDGKEVEIHNPIQSRNLGISIIYQELALAPDLTVAENIFLGELPGLIPWKTMKARAKEVLNRVGFDIDPGMRLGDLAIAYQQVVEIAKAFSRDVRVLILDEPTAVLAPPEVESLLNMIRRLRERGVSIVYISHRLEEIFQISDVITVLKDGATVGTVETKSIDTKKLIDMMVGREVKSLFPKVPRTVGETVLKIEDLYVRNIVRGVSLEAKAGEIVGIAGLVGSGRTETARAVFGADPKGKGTIYLNGVPQRYRSPKDAVKAGVALVPEDRKGQGCVLSLPIKQNTTMARLNQFVGLFGKIAQKKEDSAVTLLVKRLAVKCGGINHPVSSMSGGNQQKVVLSKWFDVGCKVIIFDEPTRGVDVGAKSEIYRLIEEFAAAGMAIIIISSDLVEVMGVSDRILVMSRGRISGELKKEEYSEANIMHLALRGLQESGKN